MEKLLTPTTHRRGFTMVELLVYIGISSIVMLVFVSFMADVTKNVARARVAQEIQQNGQFIMSRITSDIHGAQNFTVTPPSTLAVTLSTGTDTFALSSGTVTLNGTNISDNKVVVTAFQVSDQHPAATVLITITDINATQSQTFQTTIVPRALIY